jgi:ABC-type transport system involved in multi-copper enzyme maturation permease subunit
MTAPRGTVHDLGYKRYVGTRRAQSTRWRVIARNQIATAWKTFWRFKLALLLALLNTAVFGILMSNDKVRFGMSRFFAGAPEDVLLFMSYSSPFGWFCRIAFIASMTVTAGAIAGDAQSGAFSFYFARPVRTFDYVFGKLAGFWLLFATILIGGPLILAGVRLGMYGDGGEVLRHLDLLLKVIAIGTLGALAYASVPLAISALVPNRRYALALWAAYYLVVGSIAALIGGHSSPVIAALDIPTSIAAMAYWLFDIKVNTGGLLVSLPYAIGGLVLHAAAAIAILYVRVATARTSGIGCSG